MEVQTVISPGGIEAWLVEDYTVPMFALRYAFAGGSSQDPPGKEGLANFVTLLLKEGGGELASAVFEQRIENLAIRAEFTPERDAISGAIEVLSESRDEAAELVGLALARPRLDEETVARVRRRLLSFHGAEAQRPRFVAEMQWNAAAFADHPYGRKGAGSEVSVKAITIADLQDYHRRVFAKDRLKVVAVGDITAEELGGLVDTLFGALPARGELVDVPMVRPVVGGRLRVAEIDVPQSVVTFGTGAVPYDSPDYIPAQLLAHILGGHALASRLGRELREKRGLAFSVLTWLAPREHAAVLRGRVGIRNDMVAPALEVIRAEMQKMADGDLSQGELDDAKSYHIAAYPLALDSNGKIAEELLHYAVTGLGPDFLDKRSAMITAVDLRQIKRVAKYLLDPENLIVSIAGTPALQPARTSG